MPLSIAETLLYTTVRVVTYKDKTPTGTGTGFFWRTHKTTERFSILLVTNKHVLAGANRLTVYCHVSQGEGEGEPAGQFADVNIDIVGEEGLINHPDPLTDLIALNFTTILMDAGQKGVKLFIKAFSADEIPTDEQWEKFDAIEDVLMIGCPRGIMDEVNMYPIVRRGITATQLSKRYNGKSEFMVDMACFPGSSGSPVVMLQRNYTDKDNNFVVGGRFYFLGLLYQGPIKSDRLPVEFASVPSVTVKDMLHLGNVIRSTEMRVIDDILRARLPD